MGADGSVGRGQPNDARKRLTRTLVAMAKPWPHIPLTSAGHGLGTPSRCPAQARRGARHNGGCAHAWQGARPARERQACAQQPVMLNCRRQFTPQRLPGSSRLDAGCCLSQRPARQRLTLMAVASRHRWGVGTRSSAARPRRIRCNAVGRVALDVLAFGRNRAQERFARLVQARTTHRRLHAPVAL